MLLIPIAQEDSTVRRTPWVSFALIAANVVLFLFLAGGGRENAEIRESLRSFIQFLAAHPYLSPPPEVASLLGPGFGTELEEVRQKWRARGGVVDGAVSAEEQGRLNELGEKVLAAVHAQAAWRFGFVPGDPRALGVLTHMFMHAGWLHLLGNMLFLFLTAPFIEDHYGRPLFAGFYLLGGLAALAAHVAQDPQSLVPLVGASGAIAGVMGAFLVRLGTARIRFLFIPIPILWRLRTQVVLPAFVVLPLWFGEQLYYAKDQPDAGVAWWAHIGGFAFGAAAALLIKLIKVEERFIHPAIEREIGIDQNPGLERAMDARLGGDLAGARRELRRVLTAEPDNLDAWRESYETAVAAGEPAEVAKTGERVLALAQRLDEPDLAQEIVHDPRWRTMGGVAPRFRLAVAAFLEKHGDARAALDEYGALVTDAPTDPASLRALLRRAEILKRGGDVKGAREAYTRARSHPACAESWPALVEKGLRDLEAGR